MTTQPIFAEKDHVRVRRDERTGIGGATGVILELRKRSALVRWTGGDWADWIATRRLETISAEAAGK